MKWIEAWIAQKDNVTSTAENLEDVVFYVDYNMTTLKKIGVETGKTKYAKLFFTDQQKYRRSKWVDHIEETSNMKWSDMHFTFKKSRYDRLCTLAFEIPLLH